MPHSRSSSSLTRISSARRPGSRASCAPIPARHLALHPDRGCIETGTEVWNGGANYYTVAQIVVGGVDAANGLYGGEAPGLRHEEADNGRAEEGAGRRLQGGVRESHKLCYEAPKHGNDIPEVNRMVPGCTTASSRPSRTWMAVATTSAGTSNRRLTPTPRASTT